MGGKDFICFSKKANSYYIEAIMIVEPQWKDDDINHIL